MVAAIEALDPPEVIGISSGSGGMADLEAIAAATGTFAPQGGVDCDVDGSIDIPAGAPLVCEIAESGEGIAEAITSVVQAAIEDAKPVAVCTDVVAPTDPGVCTAAVSVDDGSFDPDGGAIATTQSPPGPYPVGDSAVTLKVTDVTITEFDCFKLNGAGRRIDKTNSCGVSIAGDTITIPKSNGVGSHIGWNVTAVDENGNEATAACKVIVANPGKTH